MRIAKSLDGGRMSGLAAIVYNGVRHSTDQTLEFVRQQLALAWGYFESVVVPHLSDEVCAWEPTATCRKVRRSPDGSGRWLADWEAADPSDESTTLAWDLWHLGMFLTVVHDGTFGQKALRRADVAWPGEVESAVRWVQKAYERWRDGLASLSDDDLERVGVVDARGFEDGAANPFADRRLDWALDWVNFEAISMVRAMGRAESVKLKLAAR